MTTARPMYAGLIEVPDGRGVCVTCGRITPHAEIVCDSCARELEKRLNP